MNKYIYFSLLLITTTTLIFTLEFIHKEKIVHHKNLHKPTKENNKTHTDIDLRIKEIKDNLKKMKKENEEYFKEIKKIKKKILFENIKKLKKEDIIKNILYGNENKIINNEIDKLDKKIAIEKLLKLRNKKIAIEILRESIYHYILTKDSNNSLFNNKTDIFNAIMSRAILLSAIAERETGYFNYNPVIFSRTKAFGIFQVNGNTLGFNYYQIKDLFDLKQKDFKGYYDYTPYYNSKKYREFVKQYYNGKENLRKKIFILEEPIFIHNAKELIKEMGNKNIKLNDMIIYLKRTLYGIEYLNKYCNTNVKDRLRNINIATNLIKLYYNNQGLVSFIVLNSKYKFLVKQNKIKNKLDLQLNEKIFKNIVKQVAELYNGGKHKDIYAKRTSKHCLISLSNTKLIENNQSNVLALVP